MAVAPAPSEGIIAIDTCQALIANSLVDAGVVGIDEAIEQPVLNRAFIQANWLLTQWARKRWLVYSLTEYSFVSTGALNYNVGNGQTVNINPRPDRLEYAFLRFLPQTTNNFPVDIPLDIIPSQEDYSRITVKTVGTLPWRIFYQSSWPIGVLFPWPVPQASIYEIHLGFKTVLPRFTGLQQPINFPPEYESALNWCLAKRLRESYQMPPSPGLNSIARDALNSIRLANQQMATLRMPRYLRSRNKAYSYQSDDMPD